METRDQLQASAALSLSKNLGTRWKHFKYSSILR